MEGLQRADPAARRRVLYFVGLSSLVVLASFQLLVWLQNELVIIADHEPDRALQLLEAYMRPLAIGVTLSLWALAVWTWMHARQILRAERFPPPGSRVIRDTPVLSGRAARRRARYGQLVALLLGALASIVGLLLWELGDLV